jgi:hypothetical protein
LSRLVSKQGVASRRGPFRALISVANSIERPLVSDGESVMQFAFIEFCGRQARHHNRGYPTAAHSPRPRPSPVSRAASAGDGTIRNKHHEHERAMKKTFIPDAQVDLAAPAIRHCRDDNQAQPIEQHSERSQRCCWCDRSSKPGFWDPETDVGNDLSDGHHRVHGNDYY